MNHVLIIGAGLGGLTLAQGLHRAGVSVAVYERDRSRVDRLSGYRIHISPTGSAALHESLPQEVYQRFLDTTGVPSTGYSLFTEQLRELITLDSREIGLDPAHPVNSYKSVSRITFREVLLTGLGELVQFDKTLSRYERTPDGRITAFFADGTAASGDVLVGADGVNSPVRAQYLPHLDRIDTGAFAISGKVPLTAENATLLPEQFNVGAVTIMAPHGYSGFAAVHRFRRDVDGQTSTVDTGLSGTQLREVVDRITRRWHPNLRELIHTADADTISVFPFRTSPPLARWQPSTVTLLGDAIHSMPPTAGAGANTALYDANLLRRALLAAERHEVKLVPAIGDYENQMRSHAQRYVDTAMRNLRRALSHNGVGLIMGKTALRMMNHVSPLRRRMAATTIR